MTTPTVTQKPPFVIFLGIDGVLMDRSSLDHLKYLELLAKSFPKDFEKPSLQQRTIVQSHFFNESSITALKNLIKTISEYAEPKIVVSSNWRKYHTLQTLKDLCFKHHDLAQYVLDVTPSGLSHEDLHKYCSDFLHKIDLQPCKAAEINMWLNQHPDIQKFIILDHNDTHLTKKFHDRFIWIKDNLLQSTTLQHPILSKVFS